MIQVFNIIVLSLIALMLAWTSFCLAYNLIISALNLLSVEKEIIDFNKYFTIISVLFFMILAVMATFSGIFAVGFIVEKF